MNEEAEMVAEVEAFRDDNFNSVLPRQLIELSARSELKSDATAT